VAVRRWQLLRRLAGWNEELNGPFTRAESREEKEKESRKSLVEKGELIVQYSADPRRLDDRKHLVQKDPRPPSFGSPRRRQGCTDQRVSAIIRDSSPDYDNGINKSM
jgi:hypothetical protein